MTIKEYFEKYNNEPDLVEKLLITYKFVDSFYDYDKKMIILKALLVHYNDIDNHQSELKTMLVITKPFKGNELIKKERLKLLETYNNKKSIG